MEILLIIIGLIIAIKFGAYMRKKVFGNTSSAPAKPYVPPVTLDDAEIQMLGNEAARWFGNWASNPMADHKWLVIEIKRGEMDCRSLKWGDDRKGYPGCNIKFSKTIDWDSANDIAQKVFSIISAQYPEQVRLYGLYLDGHYLILPTNGE